ncbi:MAG: PTS sugar transporter subunit IIA [Spirochaetia bacterium]|nr:PTS sugar transporter subunit IIA [Spirochaetia bacterium]
MTLTDVLYKDLIKIPLVGTTKKAIIEELVTTLTTSRKLPNKDEILSAVLEREELGSTGLADGIAIPHAKTNAVEHIYLVVGVAPEPVEFEALDGEPCSYFFLVLAPMNESSAHIEILSSIARTTSSPSFKRLLKASRNVDEVYSLFID